MPITLSGLASGLDTQTIMDSLMKIEHIPLDQLTARQTSYTQAQSSLSSFMGMVTSARTAAAALADPHTYSSLSASSSDSAVGISVTGAASPGSFTVQVTALAHEQRTMSDPVASGTDPLGQGGTIDLQVAGGSAITVNVDPADSLATIADNINKSGARVAASVLYDGSQYHLMVRGLDTGAANTVAFTESGTSLGLGTPANTYQAPTDAKLTVDGIAVTRSTNLVQGVLSGVTLSLANVMAAPATITVGSDSTALASKVSALVSAYNSMVSSAHFTAGYGTNKAQSTVLQGDSAVRTTLDRVSHVITSNVAGTTGKYTSLATIGLSTTRDGVLTFDSTKLNAALTADPTAVARLFTTDPSIGATGAMGALTTVIDSLTSGTNSTLAGRVSALGAQAQKYSDDAAKLQARLDIYQTSLQKQFTQLELNMSNSKALAASMASLIGTSTTSSSTTG